MGSKESAIVARTREVAEATADVATAVNRHRAVIEQHLPRVQRGYVTYPRRASALELGLRLCVHAPTGDSLAKRLKVVPAEYVDDEAIRCVCGETVARRADRLEQCGGCDRWFVSDDSGTWAVRLPEAA